MPIEIIAFAKERLSALMLTLFFCLRDCFRRRFVLQAEILALRHQLYNVRTVATSFVSTRSVLYFARSRLTEFLVETSSVRR